MSTCPACDAEVVPHTGIFTGLMELLAMRIHLNRDHGLFKGTDQAAELRAEMETEGLLASDKTIRVNIDRDERWLEP